MRALTHTPVVAVIATLLLSFSSADSSADRKTPAAGDLPVLNVSTVEVSATPRGGAGAAPAFNAAEVPDDVLWLARVIYSETKRNDEQELVAWTVRNRVETGYRGKSTYERVALDPLQYSAFNADSPKRHHYATLAATSTAKGFQSALRVAHEVYYADERARPFAKTTRHFYSERSMAGGKTPAWAVGKRPVTFVDRVVDPRRFRFYAAIA